MSKAIQHTAVGVLDCGAGKNPHPASDTTLDYAGDPDIAHDLDEIPWPIADGAASVVILSHVIEHVRDPLAVVREAARVVAPDGRIRVTGPIGQLWRSNVDHRHPWGWNAAGTLSDPDTSAVDLPVSLIERRYTGLWLCVPGLSTLSPILRWLARRWSGPWVEGVPWVSGELTAVYRPTQSDADG